MFEVIPMYSTKDGLTHPTLEAARLHEVQCLFNGTAITDASGKSLAKAIVEKWPELTAIMNAKPGEKPPNPRKVRADKGKPRKPSPAEINAVLQDIKQ